MVSTLTTLIDSMVCLVEAGSDINVMESSGTPQPLYPPPCDMGGSSASLAPRAGAIATFTGSGKEAESEPLQNEVNENLLQAPGFLSLN